MVDATEISIAASEKLGDKAQLGVLGGLSLTHSNGQPIALTARKSRLLLAYLAVPSEQSRSRDHLAALLWSDRHDEQARGSLRTALSSIRRALGDEAVIVEHDMVRLHPGCLSTDYDQLKALAKGNSTVGRLAEFYPGEFLAGNEFDSDQFMDWLRAIRNECADLALGIVERSADNLAREGQTKAAIDVMRDGLSLEPLKEQNHRTIMQLYAANGERAMALAQFRTCKEVLLHELDASPDPETQGLADSIALRDASVSNELRHQVAIVRAGSSSQEQTAPVQIEAVAPDTRSAQSIAVLPFVNMSGDAEQNYFADGITEDVSIDLSDFGALAVAAKSASEMYRGVAAHPQDISNELGVKYLLQGSVRKSGNNVRISALLTDGESNRQIWAERYDRTLDDIFALQSEIAKSIVSALKINLKLDPSDASGRQMTTNGEAYQLYLHGKSIRQTRVKADNQIASGLFERAIALDPNFALAYATLAECQATHAHLTNLKGEAMQKALDLATTTCEMALEINPDLAEAHLAKGIICLTGKRYQEARVHTLQAIALNPKLGDAHFNLGNLYLHKEDDFELAYQSFEKAVSIEPDLRFCIMMLTAAEILGHPKLKSHALEVLEIAKRRAASNPHDYHAMGTMAFCFYHLGALEEAKYWGNITSAFEIDDLYFAYNVACLHAILGDIDRAFEALERSLEFGYPGDDLDFIKTLDPDMEPLRGDPRFHELMARYET